MFLHIKLMISKIKDYFNISRSEWRGMIVVFLIFAAIYGFNRFYESYVYSPIVFSMEELNPLAVDEELNYSDEEADNVVSNSLFAFDPNGLSVEDWRKLGLTDKQAMSIKKYESKGGRFYKKEDLKKMFVISDRKYKELEPYITITTEKMVVKEYVNADTRRMLPNSEVKLIAINSVDSITIQLIKGIGPAYASRIIKYRDKLGGFLKKEQLREVYGVDSIKFAEISNRIEIDTQNVRYIDINKIEIEEFRNFPYLNYRQKKVILAYRKQHGAYQNVNQVQKAALLNQEVLDKITPYIKFR